MKTLDTMEKKNRNKVPRYLWIFDHYPFVALVGAVCLFAIFYSNENLVILAILAPIIMYEIREKMQKKYNVQNFSPFFVPCCLFDYRCYRSANFIWSSCAHRQIYFRYYAGLMEIHSCQVSLQYSFYDNYIDEVLVMRRKAPGGSWMEFFYGHDHLF